MVLAAVSQLVFHEKVHHSLDYATACRRRTFDAPRMQDLRVAVADTLEEAVIKLRRELHEWLPSQSYRHEDFSFSVDYSQGKSDGMFWHSLSLFPTHQYPVAGPTGEAHVAAGVEQRLRTAQECLGSLADMATELEEQIEAAQKTVDTLRDRARWGLAGLGPEPDRAKR